MRTRSLLNGDQLIGIRRKPVSQIQPRFLTASVHEQNDNRLVL